MAYVGQADDIYAIEPEVIRLRLGPRIKQRHKVAHFGIDRANVAALPADCTLCRTTPGYRVLYALMLLGDDMIHLMRGGSEILREQTVSTAIARPVNHLTSQLSCGPSGHEPRF
jgi:hypothetical protein